MIVAFYMGYQGEVLMDVPKEAEEAFLDGLVDQVGDVESSIGHVYRWEDTLVRTDTDGNKTAVKYNNVYIAQRALERAGELADEELD